MKIKQIKNLAEMTTMQLVSYIKNQTTDVQTGYVLFAKYRLANPEIGSKEFKQLFDIASSDTFTEITEHDFKPTHYCQVSGMTLHVTKLENSVVHYVTSYGGTGSHPEHLFKYTRI